MGGQEFRKPPPVILFTVTVFTLVSLCSDTLQYCFSLTSYIYMAEYLVSRCGVIVSKHVVSLRMYSDVHLSGDWHLVLKC